MESALLFILLIALYFVPWLVSLSRRHNNSGAIAVLNIFLGWTVIGWIVALIWSMTDNVKGDQPDEYGDDGEDERGSIWD
jgi:Superinfection immunity protein